MPPRGQRDHGARSRTTGRSATLEKASGGSRPAAHVRLLSSFALTLDGAEPRLAMSAQRLIAFLALHDRSFMRAYVAGSLWAESSDERAHANLRSALWRVQRIGRGIIDAVGPQLQLGAGVTVDAREAETLARHVLDGAEPAFLDSDPTVLSADLLTDWYDDWVLLERERFRQLRLRALDVLCDRLVSAGRLGEALAAGLAAVESEPLRESAHRSVIRVHLAEGNPGEAVRQYRLCRALLRERLGLEPSAQTEELIMRATSIASPATAPSPS
jgi:DNA-binding SARP family transcriptional activator